MYDLIRIPFIFAGWADFIPHIGDWLLSRSNTNPLVGYLWRYVGNGGGIGISFALLLQLLPSKTNYTLHGLLYGLFIFLSLIFTILITPNDGIVMFKITTLTFSGSLLGHIVYGFTLGYLFSTKKDASFYNFHFIKPLKPKTLIYAS